MKFVMVISHEISYEFIVRLYKYEIPYEIS